MPPVIALQGVKKIYHLGKTRVAALKGITLELQGGEFVAIAGPSGSGKTTLLNLMGCLDTPSEGAVAVNGKVVISLSPLELALIRRHQIGFVFQTFNLIPVLSAYENVELPLLLRGLSGEERKERVAQALRMVDLLEQAHQRPDELSGGQRQRVAIARAVVANPLIILADEPTGNLDSTTGEMVIHAMHKINKEKGTTFVFSTHDPKVMSMATRVIKLQDGLITDSNGAHSSRA